MCLSPHCHRSLRGPHFTSGSLPWPPSLEAPYCWTCLWDLCAFSSMHGFLWKTKDILFAKHHCPSECTQPWGQGWLSLELVLTGLVSVARRQDCSLYKERPWVGHGCVCCLFFMSSLCITSLQRSMEGWRIPRLAVLFCSFPLFFPPALISAHLHPSEG